MSQVTDIKIQVRDKNRVNISVDGKYRFSLDIFQVGELGLKVGKEYSEEELQTLEDESSFGKLYGRALEYSLIRPRSQKEVRDYLYKKTLDRRQKDGGLKKGISKAITQRVFDRLIEKSYVDDKKFTKYWVENRNQRKGISQRKLVSELRSKGINQAIIDTVLSQQIRNDSEEIQKIIAKKRSRYDDEKLKRYLAGQGFSYDDIKRSLEEQS